MCLNICHAYFLVKLNRKYVPKDFKKWYMSRMKFDENIDLDQINVIGPCV